MGSSQVKPFAAFVQEIRRGRLHVELSEQLAELVHAVDEHRKAGSLTLTVKVKPEGDGQVTVTETVTAKVPEGDRPPSIFYYDDAGNLSRTDPRQLEIDGPRDALAHRREATA